MFVSGPAQNVFVASDKHVCLQCDSEVSSRGYLIASDKHIRLQCDIVFGGVTSCILKVGLEIPPPPPPPQKKTETIGGKIS